MNHLQSIPVSVVVMTKNEEANIEACLVRLTKFEQVFIVDSNSTDRTVDIASKYRREVVNFTWNGKYPKKKQWCLENLPFIYDWVLYVDADEQLYPELVNEISCVMLNGPKYSGYFVDFDGAFLGRTLRFGSKNVKLVMFDRTRARFLDYEDLDAANMWEVEGHYQPCMRGKVGRLKRRAAHSDSKSLFVYFDRLNRYSDWEAVVRSRGLLTKHGESQLPLRRILKRVFDMLPFKPTTMFLYSYLFKAGFLDGKAGFSYPQPCRRSGWRNRSQSS